MSGWVFCVVDTASMQFLNVIVSIWRFVFSFRYSFLLEVYTLCYIDVVGFMKFRILLMSTVSSCLKCLYKENLMELREIFCSTSIHLFFSLRRKTFVKLPLTLLQDF